MDFGQMAQAYLVQTQPAAPAGPSAGDAVIDLVVGGAEIVGTAGILGYLNATSPAEDKTYHELFGYPTDALVGCGGVALGLLLALFGSQSYAHVLRVGIGALAETGVRIALEKGVEHRDASKRKQLAQKRQHLHTVSPMRQPAAVGAPMPSPIQKGSSQDVFQPVS
jgi:hypothetical protein